MNAKQRRKTKRHTTPQVVIERREWPSIGVWCEWCIGKIKNPEEEQHGQGVCGNGYEP